MAESRLPVLAVLLGVAGLIPFIICGFMAVRMDPVSSQVNAVALITYGAVILGFLGGVHWGFVLEGEEELAERRRLVLGVMPALIGWLAALLGINAHPVIGIAVLIAGFIGTAVVEQRARREELVPHGYMLLRWGLTVVVSLVLATVLVLRTVGGYLTF